MRICCLLLLCLPSLLAAQPAALPDVPPAGAAFDPAPQIFLAEAQVVGFDLIRMALKDTIRLAGRGHVFQIVSTLNDGQELWMIIRFWEFRQAKRDEVWMSEAENGKFFALRFRDYQRTCRPYPKTTAVSFGALMVPVKLRLPSETVEAFDFSRDVAMGTSIGLRQGLSRYKSHSATLLLGTGVSTVTALPQNSGGFAAQPSDLAAFTVSLGTLLDFEGVQLGLFTGMDMVPREAGRHWIYQRKPWFSVGIGYQFLSWSSTLSSRGSN
ncbi:MAG: hypothetical protein NW241_11670 [Bacteroidia bacterium]|nr:hypothetical protein [Bacteroidia bacterium]